MWMMSPELRSSCKLRYVFDRRFLSILSGNQSTNYFSYFTFVSGYSFFVCLFFFFGYVSVIWVCGFVPLLFHFVGENVRYLAFAVVVSFLFLVFGLFSISISFVLFIATSHLVTSRLFIGTALKTSRKTRANKTSETTARRRRNDNNLPMSSTFDFSARRFSVHR